MMNEFVISEEVAVKIQSFAGDLTKKQQTDLARVVMASQFALHNMKYLVEIIKDEQGSVDYSIEIYQQRLSKELTQKNSLPQIMSALRQFKRMESLRILYRDILGLCSTQNTLAELSFLADVIIRSAIDFSYEYVAQRHGYPCTSLNKRVKLSVITMGKLGGLELNFSSDIDLIFAYAEEGQTNGDEQVTNQQFFTKQVQLFIKLLTQYNAEGIVYRVDLRLRPFGSSGPLAMSFAALENYYQEQGRGWERYAMVKARCLGQQADVEKLHRILSPFVYRRYVDFSVIESLRGMKALIEREVELKSLTNDIKRGRGGIREVEFIVQACQLTRGGRRPTTQQNNLLKAIASMYQETLVSDGEAASLSQNYLFLRRLENCLQMYQDRQEYCLPQNEASQYAIAIAMGYSNWNDLQAKIEQVRRFVADYFASVLNQSDENESQQRILQTQLDGLWHGLLDDDMAVNLLDSLGVNNAQACYRLVQDFRHSHRVRRLTQASRIRLDKCMFIVLEQLPRHKHSAVILTRFIQLLESIVMRGPYIALLIENQQVIQHLMQLFCESAWIANLVANQPFLLEVLLEEPVEFDTIDDVDLFMEKLFQQTLRSEHDEEDLLEHIGQFKLTASLIIALAELKGQISALNAAQWLSYVAEFVVKKVVQLCADNLHKRNPQILQALSYLTIIAYGKFGSLEMNYESDLDLVFLYQGKHNQEASIIRLVQKILHALNTRFATGTLYPVDTRLRPSGSSGLLVSSIESFADYQLNKAWTWEKQALIRARAVFGCQELIDKFEQIRRRVIVQQRDNQKLLDDIVQMRDKMHQYQKQQDVKHMSAGLIDIEFVVQYLVLAHAANYPQLTQSTQNRQLLTLLYDNQIINQECYQQLSFSFNHYHQAIHFDLLAKQLVDEHKLEQSRELTKPIIETFFSKPKG